MKTSAMLSFAFLIGCSSIPTPTAAGAVFRREADMAQSIESPSARSISLTESLKKCSAELDRAQWDFERRLHDAQKQSSQRIAELEKTIRIKDAELKKMSYRAIGEAGTAADLQKWFWVGSILLGLIAIVLMGGWIYLKKRLIPM
jgi:hypothetical protein